jgi:hypothetical protein
MKLRRNLLSNEPRFSQWLRLQSNSQYRSKAAYIVAENSDTTCNNNIASHTLPTLMRKETTENQFLCTRTIYSHTTQSLQSFCTLLNNMLTFYRSQRGTDKTTYKGFRYCFRRLMSGDTIKCWRCENRSCSGSIKTAGDRVVDEMAHCICTPDPENCDASKGKVIDHAC